MSLQKNFEEFISEFQSYLDQKDTVGMLAKLAAQSRVVFSTSFGKEDQVLTDIIRSNKINAEIFTIDTGRLFGETYNLHQITNSRYDLQIKTWFPEAAELSQLVTLKGPDSFYESVANRLECCRIRKVEPLKRALQGANIWLTGIRHEQSPDRENLKMAELDMEHGLIKLHPLLHWTDGDIEKYIAAKNVPVNILHNRGFASIGCAPCTRAIAPGEHSRAGRWYWESGKKECGLHLKKGN